MERDDDQELWDLLGRAAEPRISPFFARNVLREALRAADRKTFCGWLAPRRLIPAAGIACIMIAVSFWWQSSVPLTESSLETLATIDAVESKVVADLEELVGTDENSLLEESVLL